MHEEGTLRIISNHIHLNSVSAKKPHVIRVNPGLKINMTPAVVICILLNGRVLQNLSNHIVETRFLKFSLV